MTMYAHHQRHPRSSAIPLEKRILASLWLLSTPDCFRSVADRFGLQRSSLHFIFIDFLNCFESLLGQVIIWPNHSQKLRTAEAIEQKYLFKGVVGAVDGCHIQIKCPQKDKDRFFNRKGYTSVILQGACDERLRFMDINCESPGSVHDSRVFSNSALCSKIEDMLPEFHVLGDSGYALMKGLMTPVRDNGHLGMAEIRYNGIHASARSMIDRAFALLKGKFRRLKHLDTDVTYVQRIVKTACVLHNVILSHETLDDDVCLDEFEGYVAAEDLTECPIVMHEEEGAKAKREWLIRELN